jgi:hypothetical protein
MYTFALGPIAAYAVAKRKNTPATWGRYIANETNAADAHSSCEDGLLYDRGFPANPRFDGHRQLQAATMATSMAMMSLLLYIDWCLIT